MTTTTSSPHSHIVLTGTLPDNDIWVMPRPGRAGVKEFIQSLRDGTIPRDKCIADVRSILTEVKYPYKWDSEPWGKPAPEPDPYAVVKFVNALLRKDGESELERRAIQSDASADEETLPWDGVQARTRLIDAMIDAPLNKLEFETLVEALGISDPAERRSVYARLGRGETVAPSDFDPLEYDDQRKWLFTTWSSLASRPRPAQVWLVDELLPATGLSLLAGPPKSGKSSVARCLAAAVSGLRDTWLGHDISTTY